MGRYKALALDIDGTLLNTKKEVTPGVLIQVERLQKTGVPVSTYGYSRRLYPFF